MFLHVCLLSKTEIHKGIVQALMQKIDREPEYSCQPHGYKQTAAIFLIELPGQGRAEKEADDQHDAVGLAVFDIVLSIYILRFAPQDKPRSATDRRWQIPARRGELQTACINGPAMESFPGFS